MSKTETENPVLLILPIIMLSALLILFSTGNALAGSELIEAERIKADEINYKTVQAE